MPTAFTDIKRDVLKAGMICLETIHMYNRKNMIYLSLNKIVCIVQ